MNILRMRERWMKVLAKRGVYGDPTWQLVQLKMLEDPIRFLKSKSMWRHSNQHQHERAVSDFGSHVREVV